MYDKRHTKGTQKAPITLFIVVRKVDVAQLKIIFLGRLSNSYDYIKSITISN